MASADSSGEILLLGLKQEPGIKLKSPAVAGLTELRTEYLINYVL
jgi:hypothetical protein